MLEAVKILDSAMALDGAKNLKTWTESLVKSYGLPREPDTILDHLPCEFTRIQQGDDLQQLLAVDLSVALAQRTQQLDRQSVKMRTSSVATSTPNYTKPTYAHAVAKVLYEYGMGPGSSGDDLPMQPGDLIAILDMPLTSDESTWWIGARFDQQTGRLLNKGIFPSNYVAVLP